MPASEQSHLNVRLVDGVAVVRFVDAEILFAEKAVTAIGRELEDLIGRQGQIRLVLDLGGVRYVTSAMLAKLVALEQKARKAGGGLRICGLGPTVKDILAVSHLDRLFEIDDDELAALAWFAKRAAAAAPVVSQLPEIEGAPGQGSGGPPAS